MTLGEMYLRNARLSRKAADESTNPIIAAHFINDAMRYEALAMKEFETETLERSNHA